MLNACCNCSPHCLRLQPMFEYCHTTTTANRSPRPQPSFHLKLCTLSTVNLQGYDLTICISISPPHSQSASLAQPGLPTHYLHAQPKMVSSIKAMHFDRLSTIKPEPPTAEITTVAIIPKKKKHIVKSIEVAIPKTLTFPTPTTPTR